MARLARLSLPGYPHHIIQRGNNGQAIVASDADYQMLLGLLGENAKKFKVALHAYALMPNHFHLLATPETSDGLAQMMQAVGRRYVRWFNDRQGRTGTLWDGRFKSTLIEASTYLLPCMVYIDLNPARAGLTPQGMDVANYPWSSCGLYTGLRAALSPTSATSASATASVGAVATFDKLITPHPQIWALGNTPFAREAAYAELVAQGINAVMQAQLTESVHSGWALGSADFVRALQANTPRRVSKALAGRPRTRAA